MSYVKPLEDALSEPLSESHFQQALAIRRVIARYGSIGAFFEMLQKKKAEEKRQRCLEQQRRLIKELRLKGGAK